jgi:hypothetical protein
VVKTLLKIEVPYTPLCSARGNAESILTDEILDYLRMLLRISGPRGDRFSKRVVMP